MAWNLTGVKRYFCIIKNTDKGIPCRFENFISYFYEGTVLIHHQKAYFYASTDEILQRALQKLGLMKFSKAIIDMSNSLNTACEILEESYPELSMGLKKGAITLCHLLNS